MLGRPVKEKAEDAGEIKKLKNTVTTLTAENKKNIVDLKLAENKIAQNKSEMNKKDASIKEMKKKWEEATKNLTEATKHSLKAFS